MKLLITGGDGLVGNAFKQLVPDAIFPKIYEYDLRESDDVEAMFERYKPTHVIHLAGKVGGVLANMEEPVQFFEDNILMNTLILRFAHKYKTERVIPFMSTCIFPDIVEYPLQPSKIHLGEPHQSNFGYAYAKRMIDIHLKAYQKQYGHKWFSVIPTNIYGPHDNFDLKTSHVIPALIHKCYLAKRNNLPWFIWGSGNVYREFIYSLDVAKIVLWLLDNYYEDTPVILSTSEQTTIRDIVKLIGKYMGYSENIEFDISKPEGQYRKPSDTLPLRTLLPNYEFCSLDDGIQKTIEWFITNYEKEILYEDIS